MESLALRVGDLPASRARSCTFGYPPEHDFVRLRTGMGSVVKEKPIDLRGRRTTIVYVVASKQCVCLFVCVQVFMKCLPSVSGNVWCFHL